MIQYSEHYKDARIPSSAASYKFIDESFRENGWYKNKDIMPGIFKYEPDCTYLFPQMKELLEFIDEREIKYETSMMMTKVIETVVLDTGELIRDIHTIELKNLSLTMFFKESEYAEFSLVFK